jgi:hypothetical protein
MFGIPTETGEDFRQTLEFLRRNRENIDSVLASQSFCVIDKATYLHSHAEEFGIRNAGHHLYWETDGNDYAERFRRYEEFCRLALSLGLPETSGVLRVKPDKWSLMGDYRSFKQDHASALACYRRSLAGESCNDETVRKIGECHAALGKPAPSIDPGKFRERPENELTDTQRAVARALRRKGLQGKLRNYLLVEREKEEKAEHCFGYPYWLTVDPSNYCGLKCPFCPTGQGRGSRKKGLMELTDFERLMEELGPWLLHADFCNWGAP